MQTTTRQIKSGNEIKAGDALFNSIDGARIGEVMSVSPYVGTLLGLLGEGTQIGTFYGGMEMTLPATSYYRVGA